jgi:beta-aspartyl-peptidase (threonine type)
MDGKNLKSGAVAIVRNVKNPVTLARAVMEKTRHTYLGGPGAIEFAQKINARFCPDAYFITDHAFEEYQNAQKKEKRQPKLKVHGTVGSVALDINGNLAAATSTGGTENKMTGRIADSSMTGIGSYANNNTCAVSSTGDGEYIMQNIVAFHISALVEYKGLLLNEACHYLIHDKLRDVEGDIGMIAIDKNGKMAFEFNSERMHRGWKSSDGEHGVGIYRE